MPSPLKFMIVLSIALGRIQEDGGEGIGQIGPFLLLSAFSISKSPKINPGLIGCEQDV